MQLLNYEVWIASSDTCKTAVFIYVARNFLTSVVCNGVRHEDGRNKWHKYMRVSWFHLKVFLKRLLFVLVLD